MPGTLAMNTRQIQEALKLAGFDPGPLDGIRGPKTIRATRAFQDAHDLEPDGIVGKLTSAALFPALEVDLPCDDRPWLTEAARLIGLQEKKGPANEARIMTWAENLGLHTYKDDETPWCGLFVAHCVRSQLPEEPLPGNPLGARNWLKFGRSVTPQVGAVLVFWRGSQSGWQGHVGFYVGADDAYFHVLGGNQDNRVKVASIARKRLLGARWPATVSVPQKELANMDAAAGTPAETKSEA